MGRSVSRTRRAAVVFVIVLGRSQAWHRQRQYRDKSEQT